MLLQKQQLQASLGQRPTHRCAPPSLPRSLVIRRAEDNPRVKDTGRTYTEGGANPAPTSAQQQQQQPQQPGQPLYAEDAQPKVKENLSPEMKKRLRDEYVGFGGTPNRAMGSNYFLWIIVVVSALAVASKITGAV